MPRRFPRVTREQGKQVAMFIAMAAVMVYQYLDENTPNTTRKVIKAR